MWRSTLEVISDIQLRYSFLVVNSGGQLKRSTSAVNAGAAGMAR